ncbi:PEP-CTERM sorting domain-containing protein [Lacipirellula parvula]|uniref:PEP-CTERM protein-sorting domain-containing protein n=1 Tax=Lacipirellula parvula TaxID=2650471 RepID=A0A5K7XA01_9BACT|nr:PEP-CTERM sorting domain-containing protein [Lacipirellula parvula]BBO33235.1 hypothetical protein PLANPX_2847 [Lacipirellula parvula]
MNARICIFLSLISLAIASTVASAYPIRLEHFGEGSGQIGDTIFNNKAFKVTGIADTQNVTFTGMSDPAQPPGIGLFSLNHLVTTIDIQDVGQFRITSGTRTFCNNELSVIGWSRSASLADIFNGPHDPVFSGWRIGSELEETVGIGVLYNYPEDQPVTTTGGDLKFVGQSDVTARFRAVYIPEPSTPHLLALSAVALIRRRRPQPPATSQRKQT